MTDAVGKPTSKPLGQPWWAPQSEFFGPLYVEADNSYHTFFGGSAGVADRTVHEVDGIERLCALTAGARVIDCPCGYGRHSVELARRGYDVVGVDLNPYFLRLARERAAAAEAALEFQVADMRDLPQMRPADAVVNMFYSFGFFDDTDDDLRVLEGFRAGLVDGGRLLIHTMITVPAFEDGRISPDEVRELHSGRRLRAMRMFDSASRREVGRWTIFDEDGAEYPLPTYSVRIYQPDELAELCVKAGFAEVRFHGDWDGSPYRLASPYLIVMAVA